MIKKYLMLFLLFFAQTTLLSNTKNKNPTKSLKILFWVNQFPTNTGGSTLNQIIGFLENNHEITILTQNFNNQSINMQHPDILFHNLIDKVFIKQLPKDKKDFDIIICQSAGLAPSLLEFTKNNNITGHLIVFVRGADLQTFYEPNTCKQIFDSFDIIAPVCEYFKNILLKLTPKKEKISVFHSSIDCKEFYYKKRDRSDTKNIKIVTTSRFAEKKGLDFAIDAIARIKKLYPDLTYLIIGDGSSRKKLESQIKRLKLEKNVKLLGWKKPEEIVKILENSHIFLLPSVTRNAQEGIPNALKEAMAMGMPVVSTYHAGIPELVQNGISGFLVPEKNARALAKKIIHLIKEPKLCNKMGKMGRFFIEQNFERLHENKKLIEACLQLASF